MIDGRQSLNLGIDYVFSLDHVLQRQVLRFLKQFLELIVLSLMILHLFLVELGCLLDERLHNFLVFSINSSRLLLFDDIIERAPHHRLIVQTTTSHTKPESGVRSLPAKELLGVLQLQLRLGHVMNELFGLYFGSLHLRHYCVRGYGPLVPLRVVAL